MYIEVQKTKTNEYIFLRSSTRDKEIKRVEESLKKLYEKQCRVALTYENSFY